MALNAQRAPTPDDEVAHDQLLTRFTAAYRGRHDPGDALLWLDHPELLGPSGAAAPAAALDALRQQVYGPRSSPEAAARLQRLVSEQQRDDAEARRALASVLARSSGRDETAGAADAPAADGQAAAASVRSRVRVPWRVVAIAVGCTAAGLGVGAAIGALEPGPAGGLARAASAPVVARIDPSIVLRSGGTTSRTAPLLSPQILPDSLHRVTAVGPGFDDVDAVLFVGRDRLGETCLLAGREFVEAACAPPAQFERSGVTLQWTTDPDGPRRVAAWRPDGAVTLRRDG